MTGKIVTFDEARLFGFVSDAETGRRQFFHVSHVRLDALGQQLPLARSIGCEVEFRVEQTPRGLAAMDLAPLTTHPSIVDLESHFELSTVIWWHKNGYGLARRGSGDSIAIREQNVMTEGELKPGMSIWHRVGFRLRNGELFNPAVPLDGPVEPPQVVRALQISVCLPEAEPSPAAVHPLLTA
jgi:cold shock CspA family protein